MQAAASMTVTEYQLISHSVDETRRIGQRLGALLRPGDTICLSGDLGAGKTVLTAGVAAGWGAVERVHSPTFVFVHEHRRRADDQRLYHVDCYRLTGPGDAETIGLDDILSGEHIVVLEWPERVEPLLPSERLWIALDLLESPDSRRLTFRAAGERTSGLLEMFRHTSTDPS